MVDGKIFHPFLKPSIWKGNCDQFEDLSKKFGEFQRKRTDGDFLMKIKRNLINAVKNNFTWIFIVTYFRPFSSRSGVRELKLEQCGAFK